MYINQKNNFISLSSLYRNRPAFLSRKTFQQKIIHRTLNTPYTHRLCHVAGEKRKLPTFRVSLYGSRRRVTLRCATPRDKLAQSP